MAPPATTMQGSPKTATHSNTKNSDLTVWHTELLMDASRHAEGLQVYSPRRPSKSKEPYVGMTVARAGTAVKIMLGKCWSVSDQEMLRCQASSTESFWENANVIHSCFVYLKIRLRPGRGR